MTELILTSSFLIMAIILLRYLVSGKISFRLQYALWILVAIRLLFPFSLFDSTFSIINITDEIISFSQSFDNTELIKPIENQVIEKGTAITNDKIIPAAPDINEQSPIPFVPFPIKDVFYFLWLLGMSIFGFSLIISNYHFNNNLKRKRIEINMPECPLPIYVVEDIPSPCLYGLRPAIYITGANLGNKEQLSHIIAHEITHSQHKDHIWTYLRSVCVVIHWFNPLVWLAASLSRCDSELACDEATFKKLEVSDRLAYGRTLIEMMVTKPKTTDLLSLTTTMSGTGKEMKKRILYITKKPKMLITTLVLVLVVSIILIIVTFGGNSNWIAFNESKISFDMEHYEKAATEQKLVSYVSYIVAGNGLTLNKNQTVRTETDGEINQDIDSSNIKDFSALITFLNKLEISKKEIVSKDIFPLQKYQINLDSEIDESNDTKTDLEISFSDDFTEISTTSWLQIGNNKRSKDYVSSVFEVKNPKLAAAFFQSFAETNRLAASASPMLELWEYRTNHLDDNDSICGIINSLAFAGELNYDSYEVQSAKEPYEITINFKPVTEAKVYKNTDIREVFLDYACIMFALIEDVAQINFLIDDGNSETYATEYSREKADKIIDGDIWKKGNTFEDFEELIPTLLLDHSSAALLK